MKVKVAQLCPTLCDPMAYTVHGILQARILQWVAFPFSRGSSQPRHQTRVCIKTALQADSLPAEPQGKPKNIGVGSLSLLQQIFLTQELNWGLLNCRQTLYQLSYQGSPRQCPNAHSCHSTSDSWFNHSPLSRQGVSRTGSNGNEWRGVRILKIIFHGHLHGAKRLLNVWLGGKGLFYMKTQGCVTPTLDHGERSKSILHGQGSRHPHGPHPACDKVRKRWTDRTTACRELHMVAFWERESREPPHWAKTRQGGIPGWSRLRRWLFLWHLPSLPWSLASGAECVTENKNHTHTHTRTHTHTHVYPMFSPTQGHLPGWRRWVSV